MVSLYSVFPYFCYSKMKRKQWYSSHNYHNQIKYRETTIVSVAESNCITTVKFGLSTCPLIRPPANYDRYIHWTVFSLYKSIVVCLVLQTLIQVPKRSFDRRPDRRPPVSLLSLLHINPIIRVDNLIKREITPCRSAG